MVKDGQREGNPCWREEIKRIVKKKRELNKKCGSVSEKGKQKNVENAK